MTAPDPNAIIAALLAAYGPQHWWPGETPLEIIVGAVLTQNTNWRNVSHAIANLREQGLLEWAALLAAPDDLLRECIRPSGVYNVKLRRLRALLDYLEPYGLAHPRFRELPLDVLRDELLLVHGVRPETADSILLYAFERQTFVIDAFTRRLFTRLGASWMARASYANVRAHFMAALPAETPLYNETHALIVRHSKEICRNKPQCSACALLPSCPHGQLA